LTEPDDEFGRAIDVAHRALGARDRTERELRSVLERRKVDAAVIDDVVADLVTGGLVDDARYAARYAEDRRHLDQWGSERIARDLARRGVEQELIEGALSGVGRAEELTAAVELLNRRFPLPFSGDKDRDRAWRLLVRRGYEPELAYSAVRSHERGVPGSQAA
jgi:regulatory protein